LPPSDWDMKTLPRTDPNQYISLLLRLGIARKGEGSRSIINPLPYSNILLYGDTVLKCFGASMCKPVAHIAWNIDTVITLPNLKIFPDMQFKVSIACVDDVIYVRTVTRYLYVLCEKPFNKVIPLDRSWASTEHEYIEGRYSVYGFSIVMDRGKRVSLVSNKPLYVEHRNRYVIEIEASSHDTTQLLISEKYTVVDLARKVLSIDNLLDVNGISVVEAPLIEFLDAMSIALPYSVSNNCVEYLITNSSSRCGNAIVKVYGYIDSIEVNGIEVRNYRHSVIRIAMEGKERVRLKLCISAFTPYAYELRKKLGIDEYE